MSLLISTNMYQAEDFPRVFELLYSFPEQNIGIELFPMFHKDCYESLLEQYSDRLKALPISFHGPYYQTEHSAPRESSQYIESMGYLRQTLQWGEKLKSRYLVFHHNNCRINPLSREEMLQAANENLKEIAGLSEAHGFPTVIENAGVKSRKNMILDQSEFISLCKELRFPVLLDIGHAHANGWNIREVMEELKDQIISFHVHNNDGLHDSHQRIFDGNLPMGKFLKDFTELTPEADFVLEYSQEVSDDVEGIKEDIRYLLSYFPEVFK